MIDSDLAILYQVETKYLNRQRSRNAGRFPDDFCFQLTKEEYEFLRCQNVTSKKESDSGVRKYMPYVFTEKGKSKNIDVQIENKFIAFKQFIDKYNYEFGFVRDKNDELYLNNT